MKRKTPKKNTKTLTLNDLARMTQQGFSAAHAELSSFRKEVDQHFSKMDDRLDRIEHVLVGSHGRRLDKVEDDMRIVKTTLERKLSITFPK